MKSLIPSKKFVESCIADIAPISKLGLVMAILTRAGYYDFDAFNRSLVRAERFMVKLGKTLNLPYHVTAQDINSNISKIPAHIRDKVFLKSLIEQAGELFDASRKIQA